jgi:hypothetical protein
VWYRFKNFFISFFLTTGKTIRLGYVFKKKSEHHTLLLPLSGETSDDEGKSTS